MSRCHRIKYGGYSQATSEAANDEVEILTFVLTSHADPFTSWRYHFV